jgi:hypothetical protein
MSSDLLQAIATVCTALELANETFTINVERVLLTVSADDYATLRFIKDYFDGFDGPAELFACPLAANLFVSTDVRLLRLIEGHLPSDMCKRDGQTVRNLSATAEIDILLQRASDPRRTNLVVLVLRQRNKVIVLLPASDEFYQIEAVRSARDLVEVLLLGNWGAALHASAVVCAGRAVCFVGPKYAGKSTTLINVISRGLGHFMANDKVLVFEEDGHFWARGLPVSAGLRIGTLRLFDSLLTVVDQRLLLHCENWKVNAGGLRDSSMRVYVRPQPLAKLLGCDIVGRSALGAIIYPRYQPGLRETQLLRLSPDEAVLRMYEALPPSHFEDQPYWTSWIMEEQFQERSRELIKRILHRVPAYALLQNEKSNSEIAGILDAVLKE